MAEHLNVTHKGTARRRLALLALLGRNQEPSGSCLQAEELAALVDGRLSADRIDACLSHLADCERCYSHWLLLDRERQTQRHDSLRHRIIRLISRPRVLVTAGSTLAAAASIAVFLTITARIDQRYLMEQPDQPMRERAQSAPASLPPEQIEPVQQTPSLPAMIDPHPGRGVPAAPTLRFESTEKATGRTDQGKIREKTAVTPGEAPAEPHKESLPKEQRQSASTTAVDASPVDTEREATAQDAALSARRIEAPAQGGQQRKGDEAAQHGQTAALALADWQQFIYQGCMGQPDKPFFLAVARQGARIHQDSTLSAAERQALEEMLNLLSESLSSTEQCRLLLDRLNGAALKTKR